VNWHCNLCKVHTKQIGEFYEVHKSVWPAGLRGCLCIGCLETIIGRTLKQDDFTDSVRNTSVRISERMLTRTQDAGSLFS